MQIIFRTVPIYFWYFSIWCFSKGYQFIFCQERTVWEVIWQESLTFFDNDEYNLFVNGILYTSMIVGFLVMPLYIIFDFTQKPAFIRKYKINPHTNEPPEYKKFFKILLYSTINGIFVTKPTFILIFYGLQWRGIPDIQTLPNIQTVLISCFISDHIFDVVNYTVHRILHHRLLYKHIHKIHHEFQFTYTVAGLYCHPLEQLFLNILPLGSGLIVLRCHIATSCMYILSSMTSSAITHSGYHLPFLNSSEFHDYHHVKFDSNYGTLGLMDRIFGTDKSFRNSICGKRDKLLLSYKSTRELYPDVNSKNNKD